MRHAKRQIERRLIKGEVIPHREKVFLIQEEHTRWISKGRAGVVAELLLRLAEEAHESDVAAAIDIPAELQRREDRLAGIAPAKEAIAVRAKERYAQEMAQYEAKMQRRVAHEEAMGK